MSRFLFALLLLMPLCGAADAIYRTTDAHGNAVFTDTPPPDGSVSEQVDLVPINTTPPPQAVFMPAPDRNTGEEQPEALAYTVSISAPLDNTTIPLGPGNFSVTSTVSAALGANNSLQLFLDGAPEGEPQRATTWALTNVFPGQHDLTAAVIDGSGAILALSPAVRIFVLRTSSIRRNRNNQ
ncbi:MAG: DUF4124 domain-containing protein [Halioglobus sp.]|nr:DUF4124 domain-containing protein [Halioglobus sp.]